MDIFILTDFSSFEGCSSVLNLSTLELKLLVILSLFSLLVYFEYLGLYVPGPVLVGMMSNYVCLNDELLNGAEYSFIYLWASLYYPGPGIAFLPSKALFFCDLPKTNAIDYYRLD
jgi:hypothetical protein